MLLAVIVSVLCRPRDATAVTLSLRCDPDVARDTPQRRQEESLRLFDYAATGIRAAAENLRVGEAFQFENP
ncbi:MAG TPA: hypothetical protein DIT01_05180 [Lentisphaeria bacterium]|nr:hypothetical protein [Lentisphaeria bacterium]